MVGYEFFQDYRVHIKHSDGRWVLGWGEGDRTMFGPVRAEPVTPSTSLVHHRASDRYRQFCS